MVAMVRMSEEDPYVFLANNENVGFPNDFLRFSANPSRYAFFDSQKPWVSIDFSDVFQGVSKKDYFFNLSTFSLPRERYWEMYFAKPFPVFFHRGDFISQLSRF